MHLNYLGIQLVFLSIITYDHILHDNVQCTCVAMETENSNVCHTNNIIMFLLHENIFW